MKPREYCCCAIPVVYAGIYTTLTAQFVATFIVAILSVATPSIVGASTPSFARWVLGIICFVAAALQLLGFIGVAREKPLLFRRYVTLHLLIALAAFAVAAAWAIISATRHSTAQSTCLQNFFPDDTQSSLGETLCRIFPWVDIGIMGGLWLILAIFQVYLYVVLSSYAASQSRDHEKYDQLNNDSIPMNARNDPWDSRPSTETPRSPQGYTHVRHESAASAADVLAQPQIRPSESLSHHSDYQPGSYPMNDQFGRKASHSQGGASTYVAPGFGDHTQRPQYSDNYYNRS